MPSRAEQVQSTWMYLLGLFLLIQGNLCEIQNAQIWFQAVKVTYLEWGFITFRVYMFKPGFAERMTKILTSLSVFYISTVRQRSYCVSYIKLWRSVKLKKVIYKCQLICKSKNELRVSTTRPPLPNSILYCLKCPVTAGAPGIDKSQKGRWKLNKWGSWPYTHSSPDTLPSSLKTTNCWKQLTTSSTHRRVIQK